MRCGLIRTPLDGCSITSIADLVTRASGSRIRIERRRHPNIGSTSATFDEGGRACIWVTSAHRCTFVGCWSSSQSSPAGVSYGNKNGVILTAVVVIDGSEVRRLVWTDGTIVNVSTHCFSITN